MPGLAGRSSIARGALLAALLAVAASHPARAEEGGFFGFLHALGGGGDAQPAPAPAPKPAAPAGAATPVLRPLTVRRTAKKRDVPARAGIGHSRVAKAAGKTGPVSIFEDPTLRSGDAVMTKEGVKVFAGGRFSPDRPYTPADFVAVSPAKTVNPNLRRTVTDLNKLPHG